MNVRMTPPQGPMGQPMPMGGAPAPMPPMGGPMPVPPMQPTAGQQQKQGLGSAFGGSAQGRGQFKNFMSAKKQTSALVPPMQASMQPMGSAPPMAQPRMAPQPMLPAPSPQMMGAMRPMGAPQMGGPVQAGRPMRGTQGGLGSAPVQLNRGGAVPRQAEIMGEPHMLAYINPEEEALLRGLGGSGVSGPGGVPSYITWDDVVSFFSSGSSEPAAPSPSNDRDERSSIPVYTNYYDAIDAEGVGATVNIGGKIVKAETADGYTGSGSNTNTSTAKDYSFMDADEEEDYNLGTGTDYSTAYDPFSNDDDDDGPSTTVVTGSSGYPSLDATANVNVDSPSTDYSFMDSDAEEDFNLGTGTTYDTVYDPFPADDDSEPVDTGGYDAVGTGSVDDPAVGGGTDYSILDPDPEEDDNLGTGATYDDTYDSGSVVVGGSDDGPSYPDTPPPPVSPPAPPPVYYDMFGGEHATQEAANEADAAYTAASNAVDIVAGLRCMSRG